MLICQTVFIEVTRRLELAEYWCAGKYAFTKIDRISFVYVNDFN